MSEHIASLLAAYNLLSPIELFVMPDQGINNHTIGVRTGNGSFVWKTYQAHTDETSLRFEHQLLRWLGSQKLSFDVPVPLYTRAGETLYPSPKGLQALFPLLPGGRPDRHNAALVDAIGAGLGELHTTLARYPMVPRPTMPAYGDLDQIHPRITNPYTLTPSHIGLPNTPSFDLLLGWWRDELAELRTCIDGPYRRLPWQVVHGDFALANTLCADGRLLAMLDFEFAVLDARAIDVAAGLCSAMRWWEEPEPLVMARAFCSGYARTAQLTAEEIIALPDLLRLRDATSAVWWLGRDLATSGSAGVERIVVLQQTSRWVGQHRHELVETCYGASRKNTIISRSPGE